MSCVGVKWRALLVANFAQLNMFRYYFANVRLIKSFPNSFFGTSDT
jgi:hypothetical protein